MLEDHLKAMTSEERLVNPQFLKLVCLRMSMRGQYTDKALGLLNPNMSCRLRAVGTMRT
jgi:hypothetical protein